MRFRLIATAVLVLLALSAPAFAGGWATTVLDEELPPLTAGDEHEIGFTILQHGKTPVAVDGAAIELVSRTTKNAHRFDAEPTGDVGHYRASVIVPAAGEWLIRVDQGIFESFDLFGVTVAKADIAMSLVPAAIAVLIATALVARLRFRPCVAVGSSPNRRPLR